jgi:hypothetical protein
MSSLQDQDIQMGKKNRQRYIREDGSDNDNDNTIADNNDVADNTDAG